MKYLCCWVIQPVTLFHLMKVWFLCGLVLSHQTLCWFSQIFINTKNTITIDIIWYSLNLAFHLSCLPVVLSHDYNNNLQEFAKEKILWVRINDCLLILNVCPMNLYTITTLLLLVGALHLAYLFTFWCSFPNFIPITCIFCCVCTLFTFILLI